MFDKWLKYSYAAQKDRRLKILFFVLWMAVFFAVYSVVSIFFFSTVSIENSTMEPAIAPGDRFIVFSYRLFRLLPENMTAAWELPFQRGDVVVVDLSEQGRRGGVSVFLDRIVRFFTAQRRSRRGEGERLFVKRVAALPGDEVSMTNFVLRVKPGDSAYTFTEYELSDKPYFPEIPQTPALWDSSLPFSGNMETAVLGDGECFVLSDDRSNTNDSRTWGPVKVENLAGKLVFRYWPFNRLGQP